jgi:DNA-binding beta-propeller fold protein YncE
VVSSTSPPHCECGSNVSCPHQRTSNSYTSSGVAIAAVRYRRSSASNTALEVSGSLLQHHGWCAVCVSAGWQEKGSIDMTGGMAAVTQCGAAGVAAGVLCRCGGRRRAAVTRQSLRRVVTLPAGRVRCGGAGRRTAPCKCAGRSRGRASVAGQRVRRVRHSLPRRWPARRWSRVIATPGVESFFNGVAVSRDGSTLLVLHHTPGADALHVYSVADGSRLRVVGGRGDGPLQFCLPRQVCIAPDDFVFVADCHNDRVQVLTPTLGFHGFVGVGQLSGPGGVCADDAVIVVSSEAAHRITVFNRSDGSRRCSFGSEGSGIGQVNWPHGLCFMSGDRHVAVTDGGNDRVSVFSVDGAFIRHVGVGVLVDPVGIACSAYDELVVVDSCTNRANLRLFNAEGETATTLGGHDRHAYVTVHSSKVFCDDARREQCVRRVRGRPVTRRCFRSPHRAACMRNNAPTMHQRVAAQACRVAARARRIAEHDVARAGALASLRVGVALRMGASNCGGA